MFFQAALDGTVKISRNIIRKSKNTEILNFFKNLLFEKKIVRIDAPMYFLDVATPGTPRKYPKKQIFKDFVKIAFFMFFIRTEKLRFLQNPCEA